MKDQSNMQRGVITAGMVLIALTGTLGIMVMSVNALKLQEETSEAMHFTPGFHHFETANENAYLNALTKIDAYGADGKIEIVDISIVYSANTVTPHYHITYKIWSN